jgi:type VI secretion system Hcp family effector
MPIFLEFTSEPKGGSINLIGNGTVKWGKKKDGLINIDSCEVEVERELLEGTGAAKNREWKSPTVGPIALTKKVDNVTGILSQWAVMGGSCDCKIYFCKSGGKDGYVEYLVWTLYDVILCHYQLSADDNAEEKGTEEISFSYLKLRVDYQEYDEDGKASSTAKSNREVDLETATGG